MTLHDLWRQDGAIEDSPKTASEIVEKHWNQGVSKALLSLSGFNTGEMYAYTVYVCYHKPKDTADIVRRLIANAPGSIKHIRLRLYSPEEKGPFDEIRPRRSVSDLKGDLESFDREVIGVVLDRLDPYVKAKLSEGRKLEVGYDVKMKLVVTDGETRTIVATSGASTPDMDKRILSFASRFGNVEGYELTQAREMEIASVEEHDDSVYVFVVINPARK